jgi:hypothetical protein
VVGDGNPPLWAFIRNILAEGNTRDPMQATENVIAQTAADCGIPEDGRRAAIAYYEADRDAIDTRLEINDTPTTRT